MRKILIIVLVLFQVNHLFGTEERAFDAEFLNHETHEKIYFKKGRKFKEFIREVSVVRKVKILSENGLNKYNRLYIPTFEDLDFRSLVFDLEAKTIKRNGDVISVGEDAMRDTSLPGNNAYFRRYEGAVKLVALEQVEVGDVIEYSYTVRYINDYSYEYTDVFEKTLLEEIPVRTYARSVSVSTDLKSRILEYNLDGGGSLSEKDGYVIYEWNYLSMMPLKTEPYFHEYSVIPHYSLIVSTEPIDIERSWNDILKRIDVKPSSRYDFISDFSVNDLEKLAKSKETVEEKVRLVCDSLYGWQRDKGESNFYHSSQRSSNWYVNNRYLSLFKKLGIESSIVMCRPLEEGSYDGEIVSLDQFTNVLIEFKDEYGQYHYIRPREPFSNIDFVHFKLQGSKALRIRDLLKKGWIEEFDFPYMSADEKVYSDKREINLKSDNDSLFYEVDLEINSIGFPNMIYGACFLNKEDSLLRRKADLFFNENVVDDYAVRISNGEYKGEVKDYYIGECTVSGSFTISEEKFNLSNNVALWQLVQRELFREFLDEHNVNEERENDAHVSEAYQYSTQLDVTSNGKAIEPNDLMNLEFENSYGFIKCSSEIIDGKLRIDLSVRLEKGYVPASEWKEFLEFDKTLKNLLYLELEL